MAAVTNTFTQIDNVALAKMSRKEVSSTAQVLYLHLCKYAYGKKDTCYPTEEQLAREMRVSKQAIQRAVKELTKAGLITVEKNAKKKRGYPNNVYTICSIPKRKIRGYKKHHTEAVEEITEVVEVEEKVEEVVEEKVEEVVDNLAEIESTVNDVSYADTIEEAVKIEEEIITGTMIRQKLTQLNNRWMEIFLLEECEKEKEQISQRIQQLNGMIRLLEEYDVPTWNEVLAIQAQETEEEMEEE